MTTNLSFSRDVSLQPYNTFGIAAQANYFLSVTDIGQLQVLRADPALAAMPRLILGGGSNLVLSDQVDALVLKMDLLGKSIVGEDAEFVYVQAQAGENWHAFVQWTLALGLGGLENLSLIPGTVGAAPIQNIGAYGMEVQDTLFQLDAFDFVTGEMLVLDKAACQFAYRDSIFKHALKDRVAITSVQFALPKQWQPKIGYADVARYLQLQAINAPSPRAISDAVIAIRQAKLPDPQVIGNAGSFFKNPLVSAAQRDALLLNYPDLVSYPQASGEYKLAAGWLIERCGWKGKNLGRAGVYEKQALVLVNRGGASGAEVRALAQAVQADVLAKFAVTLEIEPVFV